MVRNVCTCEARDTIRYAAITEGPRLQQHLSVYLIFSHDSGNHEKICIVHNNLRTGS
jgi:hypothetical protein